jgi:muramoyltetrapeptide carboxypeptidase
MRYPKLIKPGDTIGVCAPSAGVPENLFSRLEQAITNVEALGYKIIETASARNRIKCVSAVAETRVAEFMGLYENPSVAAIIPPWGGEFLMDMLPFLDFERMSSLPSKWICGYSDISTLTFVLTLCCDMVTIHGSNFMNMGYAYIHESDMRAFESMSKTVITQPSEPYWGDYSGWDISKDIYSLTNKSRWKSLDNKNHSFEGRMIGGCMDTLCKLLGTRFAPVDAFLEKYKNDGFIWTLESCEMNAADIYRTLWQMRECGWFKYCNGVIYGRTAGYSDTQDFNLTDALKQGLHELNVPVIYDADIGHVPPQIQIINGSYGSADFENGHATVIQEMK